MGAAHPRLAPRSWLRLPRRTARFRLASLYGGLFLLSGVAFLVATYTLFERATEYKTPPLPRVPRASSIQNLQLLPKGATIHLLQNPYGLSQAQQDLAQAQHELAHPSLFVMIGPRPLAQIQNQLTQAQHQLAQGRNQLARGRPSARAGRARPSSAARRRLTSTSRRLGNRARHRGGPHPPRRLARCRQDAAPRPDHHPHGQTNFRHQPA